VPDVARIRFAVALLLPSEVSSQVDGLRTAFGVDPSYIPPHVTVVPPVNVDADRVSEVLAVLRSAAHHTAAPLTLELGPLDTFLPRNPVLYLRVGGELDRLGALRDRCFAGPLERRDPRPYVPHVTITRGLSPTDDAAVRRLLAGYRAEIEIDRLHLLVQVTEDGRGRYWGATADVLFAPRHLVGTGGIEIELTTSNLPDPEVRSLARALGSALLPPPAGPDSFVVAARHEGSVVGGAWGNVSGRVATLSGLGVVPGWRRRGVGNHVVALVEHHASRRGATAIEAPTGLEPPADSLLDARGWTVRPGPGGPRRWRALGPDPARRRARA
jgi:2'-5' RNA ligase